MAMASPGQRVRRAPRGGAGLFVTADPSDLQAPVLYISLESETALARLTSCSSACANGKVRGDFQL